MEDLHKKSEFYQELYWIFTSFVYAEHCVMEIKDGKVVHSKYHEKQEDTRCYICDKITKLREAVLKLVEEKELNIINKK